jgi:hypothetical protein
LLAAAIAECVTEGDLEAAAVALEAAQRLR